MDNPHSEVTASNRTTIIVHSYSLDQLMSALIIGTGSLSMGMECTLFFTFWGLNALRKDGLGKAPLSKMNMLGLGRWMMKKRMKAGNVATLKRLMTDFKELGGKIIACEMTMEIMRIKRDDLEQDLIDDYGAVGTYLKDARNSTINLII